MNVYQSLGDFEYGTVVGQRLRLVLHSGREVGKLQFIFVEAKVTGERSDCSTVSIKT